MVRLGLRDMDKLDTGAVGHGVSASHSEEEEDSLADTEPMPTDDDLNSDVNGPQSYGKSPGRSSNDVDLAPSTIGSTPHAPNALNAGQSGSFLRWFPKPSNL